MIDLQKKPDVYDKDAGNIVFSHQVVVNSCATQTLLNTLTNLDIEIGGFIQRFIDSTNNMDSTNRGAVLGCTRELEIIHNLYEDWSLGKSGTVLGGGPNYGAGPTYHFLSYIPKNGFIWELDSLRRHPTKLEMINKDKNWLVLLGSIITEKFAYINGEASMLGIFKDPTTRNDEQVAFIDRLSSEGAESDKPISSYVLSAFNIAPIHHTFENYTTEREDRATSPIPIINKRKLIDDEEVETL